MIVSVTTAVCAVAPLADAFTVRGFPVRHILERVCEEHRLTLFARPSGTRIVYPGSEP